MQGQLRGRHTELAALKAAFDSAATRGRLAVVRGEPGSGKTELLRQAAAMWRKEGISVVSAQPRGRRSRTPRSSLRTRCRSCT